MAAMTVLTVVAIAISLICSIWTLLGDFDLVALWPSLHPLGVACLLIGIIGFSSSGLRRNYQASRLGPRRVGLIVGGPCLMMLAMVAVANALGHRVNLKLISDTSAVFASIYFFTLTIFMGRQARPAAG